MTRLAFFIIAAALTGARPAAAQELAFKSHGASVRTATLSELQSGHAPQAIDVIEPHEDKPRVYRGWAAAEILDAIYGAEWRKSEEILFTCRDGYQPSIPVSRLLAHTGYFVFAREDGTDFSMTNTLNHETVPLGPLYLVWENRKDAFIRIMGANDWPYQVTTVDLIRFSDRFPHMAPPRGAKAAVGRGFESFRQFCANCHKMNGEGGDRALDLNRPPILARRSKDWLARWIRDPAAVNPESKMPALNPKLPRRDRVVADIIAYLEAMRPAGP